MAPDRGFPCQSTVRSCQHPPEEMGEDGARSPYASYHLLPPKVVQLIVGLREDVVSLILDARSVIIPVRALVAWVSIDMGPELGR